MKSLLLFNLALRNMSLPLRERGLKWADIVIRHLLHLVAPLAGAWIEIYNKKSMITNYRLSLPLRERGLKFVFDVSGLFGLGSLPLRERGLKFFPAAPLCMSARRSPCGSVD